METRDDLLQATLGHSDSPSTSIYSARTGYLASFFGGPLAGAAIGLVNAYRLKRLHLDWPLGLLAAALTVGPLWWLSRGSGRQWVIAHLGSGGQGWMLRVLGLGFFALVYARHRQYYRNMALLGLTPPPGRQIGVVAVIGSLAVTFGLGFVLS
jgi:hypothetical protein